MSIFKLPESILDEVEKIIRRFWWGSKHTKGIYWMSWARLCRPKAEGGMGFGDMASFNLALLTKQAWRITTSPDLLLSKILKARYFPSSSFHCAELGERPSWTWRSIILTQQHLELRRGWRRVGIAKTSIWRDAWLMSEGTGKIITMRPIYSAYPNTVSDLID